MPMSRRVLGILTLMGLASTGCFNVRAPDRFSFTAPEIRVGDNAKDPPPSSAQLTSSDEQAQRELRKSRARVAELEKENRRLKSKLDETERELKQTKARLKAVED